MLPKQLTPSLTLCERGEVGPGVLWLARSLTLLPRDAEDLDWCIRANLASWAGELHRPTPDNEFEADS